MEHNNGTQAEIIKDILFDGMPTESSGRERAKWKLLARSGIVRIDPARCDIWPGNTRDVQALGTGSFVELRSSIEAIGQQIPIVARISPADTSRLEVIAGACRLTAIQQINAEGDGDLIDILVEIRDLDDDSAFRLVDAENSGRSDLAPIEKARFYEQAIERLYLIEAALAEALGVNKSTVNRTMAIVKLPADVIALITDHRQISASQASQFMTDWYVPALQETLVERIHELGTSGPRGAAAVFKALKQAVEPVQRVAQVDISNDGISLGAVRVRKGGGFAIDLQPAAGELELKPLVIAIGNALKRLHGAWG